MLNYFTYLLVSEPQTVSVSVAVDFAVQCCVGTPLWLMIASLHVVVVSHVSVDVCGLVWSVALTPPSTL